MANEILISATTGLSPVIQLYNGITPIGSLFAAVEIGSTGEYIADMPSVPYGRYVIIVTVAPDVKLTSGQILWDGSYELLESLAMLRGIDPNNPWRVTPTTENSGNINIAITGDGETESIVTRVP